jgi:ubiquinol-cytochrome c reductase iron-sulfur subunit
VSDVAEHRGAESAVPDMRMLPRARHPRRVERLIALGFVGAALCLGGFGAVYWIGGQTQAEAVLLGGGLLGLGFGMSAWGKYLMPRGPFEEERHELSTSEEDRQKFAVAFGRGAEQLKRRSFLGKLAAGAIGVFSIVAVFPLLRSLGPQPKKQLFYTGWRKGSLMVDTGGHPVHVDDLEVGGVLTVFPEGDVGSAVSQTLLLRAGSAPIVTKPGRETWSPFGYLAYSKLCTHAGCPVGLYEEQFQQLLCPCHQSLFDVLDGAQPQFGPAPRPLPQLPIYVDSRGLLRAQADYDEPVGPGFWERGAL